MKITLAIALGAALAFGLGLTIAGALLHDGMYLATGVVLLAGASIASHLLIGALDERRGDEPVPLEPMRHRPHSGVDAFGPFVRCECGEHFETLEAHLDHRTAVYFDPLHGQTTDQES